jgi:hypothetical protein
VVFGARKFGEKSAEERVDELREQHERCEGERGRKSDLAGTIFDDGFGSSLDFVRHLELRSLKGDNFLSVAGDACLERLSEKMANRISLTLL